MMFRSRTSYPVTMPSESGTATVPIHLKAYNEEGFPYLAEQGHKNIYDVVQSHHEETKIKTIVSRYEAGDSSVLGKLQGFYADMTGHPQSLQDALNSMNKIKAFYNRQSDAVRSAFPDLTSFINALGTDAMKDLLKPAGSTDKPIENDFIDKEVKIDDVEQK